MIQTKGKVRVYTECAVMIALGTVLSLIKIIDMPAGGSVTAAAMLPVSLIAYRHGTKYGLLSGLVFAALQALLGLENFSYVSGFLSVVALLLFDYILAYAAVGLAGIFRKVIKDQAGAIAVGVVLVCIIRYFCHVISGVFVWSAIVDADALVYSLGYNFSYMLPETLVTAIAGYYLASILDFRADEVRPYRMEGKSGVLFLVVSLLIVTAFVVYGIVAILFTMEMDGAGSFEGLGGAPWVVIAAAAFIAVCLTLVSSVGRKKNKRD